MPMSKFVQCVVLQISPNCSFLKWSFFGWIVFGIAIPLFSEPFSSLHEEFKRGNFEYVRHASARELKANPTQSDPRFLYLLVATEPDWHESEKAIVNFRAANQAPSKFLHQALFQFLDRLFVLGEFEVLVKWGKIFQREYKGYPKYYAGLFLLSYGHKELQNKKDALACLTEIEQNSSEVELVKKAQAFRDSFKKDEGF